MVSSSMVHPSEVGRITPLAGATVHLAEELDQTRPLHLNAIPRRTVLCLSGSALYDAPIPWILAWTACNPPSHLDPHNCKEDLSNHVVSFFSSSPLHHSQDGLHPPFSFPSKKEKKTKKTNKMHFFVSFRFVRSRQCVFFDFHRRPHRVRIVVFHVLWSAVWNAYVLLVPSEAPWTMDSNEDAREPLLVWAQTVRGREGRRTW